MRCSSSHFCGGNLFARILLAGALWLVTHAALAAEPDSTLRSPRPRPTASVPT